MISIAVWMVFSKCGGGGGIYLFAKLVSTSSNQTSQDYIPHNNNITTLKITDTTPLLISLTNTIVQVYSTLLCTQWLCVRRIHCGRSVQVCAVEGLWTD